MRDKYSDVVYELAYNKELQEIINCCIDDELKDILEKFNNMLNDMDTHNWDDDSEIYGGITFAQFKRIYMILLSDIKNDFYNPSLQIPLPCKLGSQVYKVNVYDCGKKCKGICKTCKDAVWKSKPVLFRKDHISEYGKTIFLTEQEANYKCEQNKAINEARHRSNIEKKLGE